MIKSDSQPFDGPIDSVIYKDQNESLKQNAERTLHHRLAHGSTTLQAREGHASREFFGLAARYYYYRCRGR